ncbi:MAG: A/G-specific adenine glycosylase [Verrucomicrobiota bacterium]|nr:A/G-specific adenine glycosylase [Limisphaera sp.]MDW8382910.1 A/G-specific adenine glycosylase [Verrucomicrobiota bacterium]
MAPTYCCVPKSVARATVCALLSWFGREARDLPWRRTHDPYAIWVAEVMLQQTRVKTVVSYWQRWMQHLPDVTALAHARPEFLRKLWEGLGYYRRVELLQRAARIIVKQYHGRFPRQWDEILALPGVGRYTAGAISSIAYNLAVPAVDGNVSRVLRRWLGRPLGKQDALAWAVAERWVKLAARCPPVRLLRLSPSGQPADAPVCPPCSAFNQALMELGATVCLPFKPLCTVCPIQQHCAYARSPATCAGAPQRRPSSIKRRLVVWVVQRRGRYLVRQRSLQECNGGFWELPTFEIPEETSDALAPSTCKWFEPLKAKPLYQLTHHITRYRYHVQVYPAKLKGNWPAGRWLTTAQLAARPMTRLSRKVLDRLLTGRGPA